MARFFDMKQKEVINVKDGCRYGYICDIELDEKEGEIKKIIIPGPGKVFGVFGREQEYRISWDCVKQIGDDIILVEAETKKILCDIED